MDTGVDKPTMPQNSNYSDTMALPVYDELCLNREEPFGSWPVFDFSLAFALSVNVFLLFAGVVGKHDNCAGIPTSRLDSFLISNTLLLVSGQRSFRWLHRSTIESRKLDIENYRQQISLSKCFALL